jgi:predicted ATPase/DNA-binding CsgD family transcriptional regulator
VINPNNLPVELTSFIGRERQLAELRRLLRKSRLITLTGTGGAGKTRLALRLTGEVLRLYPGGAWLVELNALSDPALLERTVAAACGIREQKRHPTIDLLIKKLTGRRTLLIFDGAEHLVDACARVAEHLLRACPELTLVVTSREPIGVRGEVIWRTPSLTTPSPGGDDRAEVLLRSEAVRLFIDRARLAQPSFRLERAISSELAELSVRLEGIPLAIELAAGLADAMTVSEIRERLNDRFRLLTGGSRNSVSRHQTLRQAVDWSYDLLSPAEQALFVRLAIFAGGFDAKAAEAVGGPDRLPTLVRLIDKSLVVAEARGLPSMRYRLLDTLREYAFDKLEHEELVEARRAHATYFLEFCKEAAAKLRLAEQSQWLQKIEDEEANIRLALAWCQANEPDQLRLLAGYMSRYWYVRGKFMEGLEWLDRALEGDVKNPESRLAPLQTRARLRRHHGDYAGSRRDAEECAHLARRLGAENQLMGALTTLGILSTSAGDWSEAERFYSEALQINKKLGDSALIAGALNNLALIDSARGRHESAKARVDQAMLEARKADDRILTGLILESAGRIERRLGTYESARAKYIEALKISSEFEDVLNIADVLDGLGLLALSAKDPTRMLALVAASSRQRVTSDSERVPWEEAEVHKGLDQARVMVGQRAADAAWQRGSTFSLKEAVAYASGVGTGRAAVDRSVLTSREIQVAALIAEGMTNMEIAGRLRITDRTVDAHVEHIRNKLGLRTRAQIAVWTTTRRSETN